MKCHICKKKADCICKMCHKHVCANHAVPCDTINFAKYSYRMLLMICDKCFK